MFYSKFLGLFALCCTFEISLCCFGGGSFSIGFGTSGPFVGVQDSAGRQGTANLNDLTGSVSESKTYQSGSPNNGQSTPERKPVNELTVSESGITFLKEKEGFEDRMYPDHIKEIPTIGYGTNCIAHPDLCARVPESGIVSRELGDQLLREELTKTVESSIRRNVQVPLTQPQYDALSSFIYHEGVGNFKSSTLLKKLNEGDMAGAAEEFKVWNKITDPATGQKKVVDGFVKRREAERELFCSGGVCDQKAETG